MRVQTNVENAMQSAKCDCFILVRMIVINRIFGNTVIYECKLKGQKEEEKGEV